MAAFKASSSVRDQEDDSSDRRMPGWSETSSAPSPQLSAPETSEPDVRPQIHSGQQDEGFRFLDLPTELRNAVYLAVIDEEPKAYLMRRFRGNLVSQSALARTNRAIREEFLSVVYVYTSDITAYVADFDFRHIVTFLNRLSEREMGALVEGPSCRRVGVELSFSCTFSRDEYGEEFALLDRWINRLVHPTKKGTKINCSYSLAENFSQLDPVVVAMNVEYRAQKYSHNQRKREEVEKIRVGIRNRGGA